MNAFANIWKHPRTTVTGLLISVSTIAGVLSQQGLTLGHTGSGTVVTLIGAVASALLGLVARDPGTTNNTQTPSAPSAVGKLGVWALIALLLPVPFIDGCSGKSVAQNIVNWTPALQTAVATVDSTTALLDPNSAAVFTAATAGFDTLSSALILQAKAYLANPSASALAQLQSQIVAFEQQVNSAMLAAAHITNTASQQHALTVIQAVATIATTMLALVESISGKTAVAQMATQSTVKLAVVEPYFDRDAASTLIARHYDEPVLLARMQVAQAEAALQQAGL